MKQIDPVSWDRASIYAWYRHMPNPHVAVTCEVDVTRTVTECRASGRSLFASLLWRLARAANQVPPLRQRFRTDSDGTEVVVEHDRVDPAYTVPSGDELFAYTTTAIDLDEADFAARVARDSSTASSVLEPFEDRRDDVLFMSCLPWLSFTHLQHPTRGPDDCFPRIAWGRVTRSGDRSVVPVNVLAHHALVDGRHLGYFFESLRGTV